ncbi:MAG: hypothetical protein A3B96_00715 [Candidatus Spechtbacteria bacterium RIFCSPHIGHO2_02_FULL_43_15b]|uniref:PrgI family protein n=1 Tax=Candidatus Spechtbacteria bacterium RIFCSPHIGHO2_01_FULL_43_30 TaxID=1802158 RepID=A0A1G2H826_9BACT|nr:MAG: hypothetical protein A2827_02585 [Candidatus Spechtbacteria bacterium RIFCSPHIGHO2_01_FULL_43_30]OGZ59523.1 MAG: hypothetical protein A3B96_00715 [Candidatus Spechtbacteria bacterium RIFCSPHIGHO2_02_FULL_43_15b]
MQQFQVPQFLGREAQLLGPLTIKQTILVVIGGGALFLLWNILEVWLFFIIAPFILLVDLMLVFLKINGRPIIEFVGSIFSYLISPQIFIWQKIDIEKKPKARSREKFEVFEGDASSTTVRGIRELAKKIDRKTP